MLSGHFNHNLDAKNRVFIPAAFRESLGPTFMVGRALRGKCIKLFSMEEWEKYVAPLRDLPRKDSEKIFRYLYSDAVQAEPDAQGRILLPASLVQYAGIIKNTVVNGCGYYAEIWSQEEFEHELENFDLDAAVSLLEGQGL